MYRRIILHIDQLKYRRKYNFSGSYIVNTSIDTSDMNKICKDGASKSNDDQGVCELAGKLRT